MLSGKPGLVGRRDSLGWGGAGTPSSVVRGGACELPTSRFYINLRSGCDIAFQLKTCFNDNTVIRNTQINGTWGSEERGLPGEMPFTQGRSFSVSCTSPQLSGALMGQMEQGRGYLGTPRMRWEPMPLYSGLCTEEEKVFNQLLLLFYCYCPTCPTVPHLLFTDEETDSQVEVTCLRSHSR